MNNKINYPFNDEFQKKLEKELINIYSSYNKQINKNIIIQLKKIYTKENKNFILKDFFPLVKYIIKDGKVSIYNEREIKKYYTEKKDNRYKDNYNLIFKTLKWCKKKDLPIPNTELYIWISDSFPWYIENLNKFPIYVYAKPNNQNFPIFPDNTFECFQLNKKYKGECYDWDNIKKIVKQKCNISNKEKLIYFKGTSTTRRTYKLRENLEKYQEKFNIPMKILLDAWEKYEHIYKFCKYLYLLNLPGHYPWSNRLKYLFLMNSIVINININTISLDPEYKDPPYITLIDYVVDKKDFVEIIYNYYRISNKLKNLSNNIDKKKIIELQKKEFDKFTIKLKKTYIKLIKNPDKYKKMAINTTNKVNQLTNERIYQYIYKGIVLNSNIIKI